MKTLTTATVILVSLATVGCSEVQVAPTDTPVATENAFTVLSDDQVAEREAAASTDFYNMTTDDLNVYYAPTPRSATFHADSELNSHLVATIVDITYAGEAGYFFEVNQNLGEGQDVSVTTYLSVSHAEVNNAGLIYDCIGGVVAKCQL